MWILDRFEKSKTAAALALEERLNGPIRQASRPSVATEAQRVTPSTDKKRKRFVAPKSVNSRIDTTSAPKVQKTTVKPTSVKPKRSEARTEPTKEVEDPAGFTVPPGKAPAQTKSTKVGEKGQKELGKPKASKEKAAVQRNENAEEFEVIAVKSLLPSPYYNHRLFYKYSFPYYLLLLLLLQEKGKPKRAKNPFNTFSAAHRGTVKSAKPDASMTVIAQELARMWNALPKEEQADWNENAPIKDLNAEEFEVRAVKSLLPSSYYHHHCF